MNDHDRNTQSSFVPRMKMRVCVARARTTKAIHPTVLEHNICKTDDGACGPPAGDLRAVLSYTSALKRYQNTVLGIKCAKWGKEGGPDTSTSFSQFGSGTTASPAFRKMDKNQDKTKHSTVCSPTKSPLGPPATEVESPAHRNRGNKTRRGEGEEKKKALWGVFVS